MGLLALVAAAGKRGVTRERIIGVLWGEVDEEPARHTLSQNLYTLRRETGRDWIAATPELRLDAGIASDVGEFQDAIAARDYARAAELYSGAFLEGFYLPGAPDFERWVEEERARLKSAALQALEAVAARAEADQSPDAIGWWRRLTELDPLRGRYAAGLMRSLAAAGDNASALVHVRSHRNLVKRELDAEVDPAVRALASTLKEPGPAAPALRPPAPTAAAADREPLPAPHTHPGRPPRRVVPLLLGVAILLVVVWQQLRPAAAARQPFLAVGAIRAADSSGQGGVLRDMLATSLGSIRGLQVVANSRLVELMPRGADTIPGATTDAARRAGATEILEGELVPAGAGFGLTLRRVALGSGVVRQGYTIHAADPAQLIDSATAAIARDLGLASPSGAVATIRTSSPTAYALYEEGLRAAYQWDAAAAYRLMTAALEHDSAFAMAAYYAWFVSRGTVDDAEGNRLLRRAKRLAPRAIDRERLLIEGWVAGLDAPIADAVAIAETLTVRYPSDPDGQILLGTSQSEAGNWAASVAAFNRAVSLDSAAGASAGPSCRVCNALVAMTHTYMFWDSAGAAVRTARRLIALRPDEPIGWGDLAEPLLRLGRPADAEAALARRDSLSSVKYSSRSTFQRDLIRQGRFPELDAELASDLHSRSSETRSEALWLMLISLRNQGRLRDAMALARDGLVPGVPQEPVHLAVIPMESGRPREAAARFQAQAAATLAADLPPGFKARVGAWQLTLAGTALALAGDTAAVHRLADSVELVGRESSFGRDPRLHHFLRGLILQRAGRHAEAVESFRRAMFSPTDGYTRINLELGRSLMALGRGDEAIGVLRPALHGGVDGSNTYVTHTELHEALAQAFELAGQADSAVAHFRMVEAAWRHADPEFGDRYARAKARSEKGP
jgi:DNA-binding SARP family transcriptional activator/predicted Zn-dependent protease